MSFFYSQDFSYCSFSRKASKLHWNTENLKKTNVCNDLISTVDCWWRCLNSHVAVNVFLTSCFRSLGVHLSKVRSLTLDSWEAEQLKVRTKEKETADSAKHNCHNNLVTVTRFPSSFSCSCFVFWATMSLTESTRPDVQKKDDTNQRGTARGKMSLPFQILI